MKTRCGKYLAAAIMVFVWVGSTWAGAPVAVSPGATDGVAIIGQSCPTFSWSSADNAVAYHLEVYEQATAAQVSREVMAGLRAQVIKEEIPAPALSWTPASGGCLPRGLKYVWFVHGVDASGNGLWSEGRQFEIEASALTVELRDALQEVVKEYLSSEGTAVAETAATGGATTAAPRKTASAISPQALPSSLTAYGDASNTVLGSGAGASLTAGVESGNTFIGASAGAASNNSNFNTFIGSSAGVSNTGGGSNLFVGASAGYTNAGGSQNVFVGPAAGNQNSSGNNNSFVGYQAGFSNTSGAYNSSFGYMAGYSNQTGGTNSTFGYQAGYHNITSTNNFFGYNAGYSNTWGYSNNFFGYRAGYSNIGGNNNSFIGYDTGYTNTAGIGNSFFGNYAGYKTTGDRNVFLGWQAGYSELGSHKLYIDNCITGMTLLGQCTQPLIYGEFDNRVVKIDGSLTIVTVATPSDVRYKKDVHPLGSSLDKVLHLQGVTYEWDKDRVQGAGYKSGRQIGLIAQEVEKVLPELVHTDSKGYKTLSYDKLVPVLVEAMKEQQVVIEGQKKDAFEKDARIEKLEQSLNEQQQAIASLITKMAAIENQSKSIAMH